MREPGALGSPRRAAGSIARVSPTTRPGSSPAGRGSRTRPRRRRAAPARSAPAARCSSSRLADAAWAVRERTPPRRTSSPALRGADETRRGRGPAGPAARSPTRRAGAKSSTAASRAVGLRARRCRAVTVASATTRGGPARQHVRVAVQLAGRPSTVRPASADRRAAVRPPAPPPGRPPSPRATASPASTRQDHGRGRRPPARQDGGQARRRHGAQRQLRRGEQRAAPAQTAQHRGRRPARAAGPPTPAPVASQLGTVRRACLTPSTSSASSAAMAGPMPGTSSS